MIPKKKARDNKKRKASTADLSSAATSDNENTSQNAAYYIQLAVDNLILALNKETDQSAQTKIQFLLTKAQHILLNTADFESDSQVDLQHQIQTIKSDIEVKFKEIQTMIANLQFINIPASNSYIIAEPASQSTSQSDAQTTSYSASQNNKNLTQNSELNSTQSVESMSYAQAAANANANERYGKSLDKVKEKRNISARSSLSSKQTTVNSTKNSESKFEKSQSTFSYRERRLILTNSRNSAFSAADAMILRDKINKEFQLQLKINKPVITAITKSYKQQNIVLITMSNYNADYLVQHENIWKKYFKYQAILKDKA